MTKVKFCGMRLEEDIEEVNRLNPDYIGFILSRPYWRCITFHQASLLKSMTKSSIQTVGVFVDEPIDTIKKFVENGIIDVIQLHGSEDEQYIARLKNITEKKIFRAFKLCSPDDAKKANDSCADMILLDSGRGTGETFDWELLRLIERPYFLAGGLNAENIGEAVRTLTPYGVDVSSGIETDRRKNPEKMKKFIDAVRSVDKEGGSYE